MAKALKVRLRPEAKADIGAARDWYSRQREGLDLELRDELAATLRRIAENPLGYAVVHAAARAAPLRRFPYLVFYLAEAGQILVVAVLHASRHPEAWQARL